MVANNLRDDKNKLETAIKYTGDASSLNMNELNNKILFLEEKQQIDESERAELRNKLSQ